MLGVDMTRFLTATVVTVIVVAGCKTPIAHLRVGALSGDAADAGDADVNMPGDTAAPGDATVNALPSLVPLSALPVVDGHLV